MSQSFIKKPNQGPHSALTGLGVLRSEQKLGAAPSAGDAAATQRIRAALEKLLIAEEKYVRDTGLPQPDDFIQASVNEARTLLGWPAIGAECQESVGAGDAASGKAKPVGVVGAMPGTSGFTMACFKADQAPVGTKLYATPPASPEPQPKRDPLALPITACPRCNAASEEEAGSKCIPGEDDCPMCCREDWNEALTELNRQESWTPEPQEPQAGVSDLIGWLESLRPLTAYGRVGSRDVDQAATQKALNGAIEAARSLLSTTNPPAQAEQPNPACQAHGLAHPCEECAAEVADLQLLHDTLYALQRAGNDVTEARLALRRVREATKGTTPREPQDLSEILSGETLTQREEVCAAWADLPDDLRKDERLTRLYRALGGPRMDDPTEADSAQQPLTSSNDQQENSDGR